MTISLQISGAPMELASVLSLISGITPVETSAPQVPFALPAEPKKLETSKTAKAEISKPKVATNVEAAPAVAAPVEPVKEEPKETAPISLTVEMIRAEAARIKDTKRAELQALLAEFSTNSITNLSPGNYQAFYLRIKDL